MAAFRVESPTPAGLEARVVRQRDALLKMMTEHAADAAALPRSIGRMLELAAETLNVSRVGLWRFTSDRHAIECTDVYESAYGGRHQSGERLQACDFPVYFKAIETSDVIAAMDACTDPRTAAFSNGYLRANRIGSLMDVPAYVHGGVDGVLCHEHTEGRRDWTADERAFGIAVASMIALRIERAECSRVESVMELQAAALDAAASSIMILDRQGRIAWANRAFTTLTGFSLEETVGRNAGQVLRVGLAPDAALNSLHECIVAGCTWTGELTNRRKDGSTFTVRQAVTPVAGKHGEVEHFVSIKYDLTEQRRLESEFLQAQKMEVVGRLAGGIAHDFNNLLTVINGSAELALTDLDLDSPVRIDFERIREAGARATALTRQLLSFSRKRHTNYEAVNMRALLESFHGVLQRMIGEDVALFSHVEGDAVVYADPAQIEQIILNLAVNARDAMPKGGALRVDVSVAKFAGPERAERPHVEIAVSDTGEGMAPEVMEHIFEPFFTTKENGKGTGLGLATVSTIVNQLGGTVKVASVLGRGTTFTIFLPRMDASSAPVPAGGVA